MLFLFVLIYFIYIIKTKFNNKSEFKINTINNTVTSIIIYYIINNTCSGFKIRLELFSELT